MASRIFGRYRKADPEAGLIGAARIVEFSLWLAWSTLILVPLTSNSDPIRDSARFLSNIAAVLLILTSLYWILKLKPRDERGLARRWALFMLAISISPALYALTRGNSLVALALTGIFPFVTAVSIFLGAQPLIAARIERAVFWQVALGVVFALYVLAFHPPQSRLDWNGATGFGLGKYANRVLAGTSFLLPLIHRMPTWKGATVLVGLGLYIVLAIGGSSRGMLLIGAGLLPLGYVLVNATTKRRWLKPLGRAAGVAVLLLFFSLVVTNRLTSFGSYLGTQWETTTSRITGGETEGSLGELGAAALQTSATEFSSDYSRGAEFRDFLAQFEAVDLLAGRGFGGTWYSSFWQREWRIVHIGPGHLLLQGGVPLLIAFFLVFLVAIVRAWRGRSSDLAAGALLYLLAFIQHFMQHGAIGDDQEVYLTWLCVGIALAARPVQPSSSEAQAHRSPRLSLHQLQDARR